MDSPNFKRIDITEADRSRILDKLDQSDTNGPKNPRRATARLDYRIRDVPFTVVHPGGGFGRFLVLGRNLSTGGISLLHAGYLHSGTECRLALVMPRGGAKTMLGKVVFCRLVAGKIHEIGVQFCEKIDIAEFVMPETKHVSDDPELRAASQPLSGNVLLVCPGEAERRLLTARLKQSGLNVSAVDRAGAGLDQVKLMPYAALVCDLGLPDPGAAAFVESLRKTGFAGPIVGAASDDSPGETQRAIDVGMQGCITRPLRHDAMHQVLMKVLRESGATLDLGAPIASNMSGDPGADELIQFFITHARECAGKITGAIPQADVAAIRKECHSLKSIAAGYGFPSVGEAARQAMTALDATMSLEESISQVQALLNVCSRLTNDRPDQNAA